MRRAAVSGREREREIERGRVEDFVRSDDERRRELGGRLILRTLTPTVRAVDDDLNSPDAARRVERKRVLCTNRVGECGRRENSRARDSKVSF